MHTEFDDIRPYRDEELPAAMARIAANTLFPALAAYIYPGMTAKEAAEKFLSVTTVGEFHATIMHDVVDRIISYSTNAFTWNGVENISAERSYLYTSNHRDIALDATLLCYILFDNGIPVPRITFGDNLMQGELVIDLGKSNKMFKLIRGGTPREFLQNSILTSRYMRHSIVADGESVWIAQRGGRTKNGIDLTEPGLIKMFSLSGGRDTAKNLAELNITPVSVSYEWEPCDVQKARELFLSQRGKYTKAPGEDLGSILSGITQPKGRVHFHISAPLSAEELEKAASEGNAFDGVAAMVDRRVRAGYRLWENNYIAHDILHGCDKHSARYTAAQKQAFELHMRHKISSLGEVGDPEPGEASLNDIFLGIYANPVDYCG